MSMPANIVRSPSYPSTPLGQAVEQVGKIEGQYRSSQVDRAVAAKLLGYSGLNGPSAKALAALAHYGLVERAGKGEMRVTPRAQAILHPDSAAERLEHLRAAALEPNLFRELQERWPGLIPPEDGVETHLSRKGFNQTAIRPAARAYLETLLFLKQEGVTESYSPEPSEPVESPVDVPPETRMHSTTVTTAPPEITRAQLVQQGLNQIRMNIEPGRVTLAATLDRKGLLLLEKKLVSLKALLEDDAEEDEGEDS